MRVSSIVLCCILRLFWQHFSDSAVGSVPKCIERISFVGYIVQID